MKKKYYFNLLSYFKHLVKERISNFTFLFLVGTVNSTQVMLKTSFIPVFFFSLISLNSAQEKLSPAQIDSLTTEIWKTNKFNEEGLAKAKELYYLAKEVDYKKGQIKLLIRITDLKVGSYDLKGALEYLKTLKALSLSEEDYESYISACGLEAKIFFMDKNFSQANKILRDTEQYLPKIKDLEKRRTAKIEIYIYLWYNTEKSKIPTNTYLDSLVDIAQKIYNESIHVTNKKHRANRVLFASNLLTTSLTQVKKYKEASHYLKIAGEQVKIVGDNSFLTVDYYEAKGDLEYQYKRAPNYSIDNALASYNKAIEIGEKLNYSAKIKDLYAKVAEIYGDKKDQEKQINFLEKSQNLKEKIQLSESKALGQLKNKVYEVKEVSHSEMNDGVNSNKILASAGILFLLGFSIYGFKRFKRNRIKISEEINSREDNNLTAPGKSVGHLIDLAYKNNHSFYIAFLEAFPDFADKLMSINPSMKNTDIEFCAYIKLNLDTKQIAVLKNMSVRAVEGKKYRIRKKLNISSEENMYIWFSKL